MNAPFDRSGDDVGNILGLDHLNLQIPDQGLATVFYVVGLGFTRDPYMMVGTDNMWVNLGRQQFHLLTRPAQVVNGRTGLVVEDLDALEQRLAFVRSMLADTRFGYERREQRIDVCCPWGNVYRCHRSEPAFGRSTLGMPYIEFDVKPGAAHGIARFYQQLLGASARIEPGDDGEVAIVPAGVDQQLRFRETAGPIRDYDGYHIQLTLADFTGTHRRLQERDLVSEESNVHQYRFVRIVDPDTGALLAQVEHELRSVLHPMYARPLVNRNAAQSVRSYTQGADAWRPAAPPIVLGARKLAVQPS